MNQNTAKTEFKINLGFFQFSLSIPIIGRKKPVIDPTIIVAKRFIQIFKDHGVKESQIPRFIPQITLDRLRNADTLLPVLTDDVIEKTANLFLVRRAWLEGTDNRIYDYRWCYKSPKNFFEDLSEQKIDNIMWPIMAFCRSEKINCRGWREQPLVLVLAEKIADLEDRNENEILRYRIYHDGWNWNYWKCRIQLKAMMRVMHKKFNTIVPLWKVSPEVLEKIEHGLIVPNPYKIGGLRLRDVSLEDFVLSPEESAVSKESEELTTVIEYIERNNLEAIADRFLSN